MTKTKDMALSILLLLIGMVSIQFGATMAKHMFDLVPPAVITMIRTSFAAIFLLVVLRPWREPMKEKAWLKVALYGSTLGIMNLLFYLSLRRIPLGIAVALEFVGPLGVALLGSRRALDLVWIALAVFGLYLLLPLGGISTDIDPLGALLALAAGLCWGLYIIFGKRVGAVCSMRQAASFGMIFAALVVLPFGLHELNPLLVQDSSVWIRGLFVAIMSSAIPYTLEMIVLKKMDSKTFGTLMSIEPVIAALAGLVALGEVLSGYQILAMVAIVGACLGATLTAPGDADLHPTIGEEIS